MTETKRTDNNIETTDRMFAIRNSSVVDVPQDIQLFDVFGDFDRFAFPGPVYRVTGGHGGEALLICGSEKTALLDCGMAYCAEVTLGNTINRLASLGRERLDYILLSHSHYDHIGALPWFREAFPQAEVCGSAHCAHILERPNAHALMKELGEDALQLYEPGSTKEIRVDGLGVDRVLADGDVISLGAAGSDLRSGGSTTGNAACGSTAGGSTSLCTGGAETITAYETKGHTDCSVSFLLEPASLLFTSESTGIIEGKPGGTIDGRGYIHTPVLKDFSQARASMEKCRALHAEHVCLPHFGMVPDRLLPKYWEDFDEECESKIAFARLLKEGNLSDEEMLDRYAARYWTAYKAMEQPKEAFLINSKHILKALIKEIDRRDS